MEAGGDPPSPTPQRLEPCSEARSRGLAPRRGRGPHRLPAEPTTPPVAPRRVARARGEAPTPSPPSVPRRGDPPSPPYSSRYSRRIATRITVATAPEPPQEDSLTDAGDGEVSRHSEAPFSSLLLETVAPTPPSPESRGARGRPPRYSPSFPSALTRAGSLARSSLRKALGGTRSGQNGHGQVVAPSGGTPKLATQRFTALGHGQTSCPMEPTTARRSGKPPLEGLVAPSAETPGGMLITDAGGRSVWPAGSVTLPLRGGVFFGGGPARNVCR